MKAIICTQYGAPEVLKLVDVEKPTPAKNEVSIKIHATSVTAADIRLRAFDVPPSFWLIGKLALGFRKPRKPILGMELSGEIESIGQNVSQFKVGDQVIAALGSTFGSYAAYKCMPANSCISKKPKNISYGEAAVVPLGACTALHFLKKAKLDIESRKRSILIYGASGSVGTYAIQIAKYYGATVTAVCSTTNKSLVRSIGADHIIDYTKEDFTKSNTTYDIIFDCVGKTSISKTLKSLAPNGYYLQTVAGPGLAIQMLFRSLFSKKKLIGGTFKAKREPLEFIVKLIEKGFISPVIDQSYPLENIVDAHRYVDTGRKKGNVIIQVI